MQVSLHCDFCAPLELNALTPFLTLAAHHREPKQKMASAESQPRFGQSVKGLLSDKVGSCSVDVIALTRQVLKGSRSQEVKRHDPFYPGEEFKVWSRPIYFLVY